MGSCIYPFPVMQMQFSLRIKMMQRPPTLHGDYVCIKNVIYFLNTVSGKLKFIFHALVVEVACRHKCQSISVDRQTLSQTTPSVCIYLRVDIQFPWRVFPTKMDFELESSSCGLQLLDLFYLVQSNLWSSLSEVLYKKKITNKLLMINITYCWSGILKDSLCVVQCKRVCFPFFLSPS